MFTAELFTTRHTTSCRSKAVEFLASIGASSKASHTAVQAQIEASVAGLLQDPGKIIGREGWSLEARRWTTLGLGLLQGHDDANAVTALEQSTIYRSPCFKGIPYAQPRFVFGPPCFKEDSAFRHLCKRGAAMAICKDHYLERHLHDFEQLGRLETAKLRPNT